MFCSNCGTQLPEGAKFCPGCGAPAGGTSPAASPRPRKNWTVRDALQLSGTPVMMAGRAVDTAQAELEPDESVEAAIVTNCTITGQGLVNGCLVVTDRRVLFCGMALGSPRAIVFDYREDLALSNVQGGETAAKMTMRARGITIRIEIGTRRTLNALSGALLDAYMEYPSHGRIETIWADDGPAAGRQALPPHLQRIRENRQAGVACCPRCGSTSLSANKKGFGLGKAALGGFIAGPVGLIGGAFGANKVVVTCLSCGHKFKPGR